MTDRTQASAYQWRRVLRHGQEVIVSESFPEAEITETSAVDNLRSARVLLSRLQDAHRERDRENVHAHEACDAYDLDAFRSKAKMSLVPTDDGRWHFSITKMANVYFADIAGINEADIAMDPKLDERREAEARQPHESAKPTR